MKILAIPEKQKTATAIAENIDQLEFEGKR